MSLVHGLTGEQSRFRRWTLFIFARYLEVPLLGWSYRLLRGRYRRLGRIRPLRALLGRMLAYPFAVLGDTGRPMPAAAVLDLIDSLDGGFAVGPCRCRIAHRDCDHPLETDIVIRTGVEAWTRAFPGEYRMIEKEEAKRIVSGSSRAGMWQMVFVHCPVNEENEYVICNCCECGCVPYILNRELGQARYPLLPGTHVSRTDTARCTGRHDCVTACPFDARTAVEGGVRLTSFCFGCGACEKACPEGAITMALRPGAHKAH